MASPVEKSRSDNLLEAMANISNMVFYDWDVCVIGACSEKVNALLKENGLKPCEQSADLNGNLDISKAIYNILHSKFLITCWDGDPKTLWQLGLAYGARSRKVMIHDERKLDDEMDRHFPVLMRDSIPIITFAQSESTTTCALIHDAVDVHFDNFDALEDFIARYASTLRKLSRMEINTLLSEDFRKKPRDTSKTPT